MPILLFTHKEIKTLCNTLDWGNWNSGLAKLGVRWAEQDKSPYHLYSSILDKFEVHIGDHG